MTSEVELSAAELLILVESAKELSSEIDLSELLGKILLRGATLTGSPSASIFLDDPGRGLFAAAASGPKAADLLAVVGEDAPHRVPYEGSKAGEVFTHGISLIVDSIASDPHHFKAIDRQLAHQTESMVCVPLLVGDQRIGAVQLLNKASGNYDRHDVLLLEHLASHAALAIQNARLIRELLAHKGLFASPSSGLRTADLVRELSAKPDRERMTILFADMRGFTRLVQSIGDPIETVTRLNEFLDLLAEQVLRHDGLVNKFLGDGILALFRGRDTERRGASAAFDIVDAFDELKEKWLADSGPAVDFVDVGIGLVTGNVIIGSIGSGRVRDFTAIGALVNLAAAFEADARGGQRILADQGTVRAIEDIVAADQPTIYEMRKPDQPSGVRYTRYHIRRLRDARAPTVQAADIVERLKPYYHSSWAVVVGINEYKARSIDPLSYALSDVRQVAQVLPSLGFPEGQIQVLENESATKENITKAIYNNMAQMTDNDRLLIFFAGHGEVTKLPGGDEGYLLPYDADPTNLRFSSLPMYEFARIGRHLLAKHILLVLDSCFSGYAARRTSAASAPEEPTSDEMRQRVVEVLTAGTSGQQAAEEDGHGIFTRAFLKGLAGDADPKGRGLTALKLGVYIKEQLDETSQSPQVAKLDGEGEFLFIPPSR